MSDATDTPASQVRDVPSESLVEITIDGTRAGFVRYETIGDSRAFTHTEIEPAYGGQGLGSILVRDALDDARAKGLLILPFCPFVRRYVARHPEYLDLVPAEARKRFGLPTEDSDRPQ